MNKAGNAASIGLLLLVLAVVTAIIVLSSVPPVSRDALTHHLFVPKLYLQHGGIYEIPEIPFSYYPMNLDLLYMIPLYFGNDIIAKYIHFLFALATAILTFIYLRRRTGISWALFGALFFLTIPVIIKLSITVYVDLGLIFFSTAALLALLTWIDRGLHWRWLLLCGLCAGLAAGTKYNGLVTVAVIGLLAPFCYSRIVSKRTASQASIGLGALAAVIIFAGGVLLTYSPWMVRNYVWTGNPVYPLHQSLFAADTAESTQSARTTGEEPEQEVQARGRSNIFVMRRMLYGESAWQTLTLPVRFFLQGQDDTPRYFDGKLSPFLLVLPLLAFLGWGSLDARQKRERLILLSFSLLYFFFTFFQSAMRVRYIAPSLPPLIILSTLGLHSLCKLLLDRLRLGHVMSNVIMMLLATLVLLPNFIYLAQLFPKVRPFDYLSGRVGRDDYITAFRPEYRAIQWLNERTSSEDRVLSVFLGNRGYYMEFFPVFASPYANSLPLEKINSEYVLVRDDLFSGWLSLEGSKSPPPSLPFDPGRTIFSANGYSVYPLVNSHDTEFP